MKAVSGEVISSKSISLKKAAKTLSKFASSDNCASPAFAAYLRRASASFNELVQLHKESKSSGSEHKVKKRPSKDVSEGTYESAIADKGSVKDKDFNKRKDSRRVNKGEGETGGSNDRDEVRKFEGFVDGNGLKSETESFDGSQNTQKKKRDKFGTEKHDVSVDIEKKIPSFPTIENVGNSQTIATGKKHGNKQKKNREQSSSDHAPIIAKNETESIDQSKEMKKKKKNKQKSDDDGQSTGTVKNYGDKKKGHLSGDHSTYLADVHNELDSFDGNKEKKKKKKSDEHGNIKSGAVIDKEKEMHSDHSTQYGLNNEATRVVDNAGDGKTKRKKNKNKNEMKDERFGSSISGDQQRNESNNVRGSMENVDKKKRTHEGKERINEGKLEIDGVNNKESRKRKHDSLVVGGFDGSQEQHNLKKKKR